MAELTNQHFHGWVVREMVGSGGAAEVYRADHVDDARARAALKVLRPERQQDKRQVQALTAEFALLERLKHAGLPHGRRLGEIAGRAALLMDFVPGTTLAKLQSSSAWFDPARTFISLLDIAAYLHRSGVVHNDLKLENCLIDDDGRLWLVDFGSAREPARTSIFRRFFGKAPTAVFGTAAYIAPEVLAGHHPSYASDVYALGVCAFAILAGELPFGAASRTQRLHAHQVEAPPSIRDRLPQLPPRMIKAIDACLAKSPMSRPGDANDLLTALTGLQQALPPPSKITGRITKRQGRRSSRSGTKIT
jgi:serine/threonine-protein kinase